MIPRGLAYFVIVRIMKILYTFVKKQNLSVYYSTLKNKKKSYL